MLMGKQLIVALIMLMATWGAPSQSRAEDAMAVTGLHHSITQQKGWLNTARALKADDLKGRIILLDFWTYCCINCMQVIPDLHYLEETFGDELTVIGVHSAKFKNERDSDNIRQAILRYGIHHPVVNDFDFSTWNAFGIHAWPTFVLINPKGMVEASYSGEGNRKAIERDIKRIQEKYAGAVNKDKLPIALEKDKQPAGVLSFPGKITYAPDFNGKPVLFVSDSGHHRIVVMALDGTIIESIGSGAKGTKDGDFTSAQFNAPQGVLYDAINHDLFVADTMNHALRVIDFDNGVTRTLAGNGHQGFERNVIRKPALEASLASPWDLAFYPDDKHIVIAMAGLHQLWSYDVAAKTVTVIAGNGAESIDDGRLPQNSLSQPSGLSAADDKLYFVDAETSSLRVLENGEIRTLIGSGLFDFGYKEGLKGTALMQHPLGLYAGDKAVYIADSYNHSIRRFDTATEKLSNFVGNGKRKAFSEPGGIVQVGEKLYIADTNHHAIRVIDVNSRKLSTLAVTEKQSGDTVEFSEDLPNLEISSSVTVEAGAPVSVTIRLQEGWHLNKDAPSYLALFDMKGKPKAVTSFDRDTLRKGALALPALGPGTYRLQGTLYYCEDKAGAQCLLKSFDVPLQSKAGGQTEINLSIDL